MLRRYLSGLVILSSFILVGCGGSNSGSQASGSPKLASGGTFVVGLSSDPGKLNPMLNNLAVGASVSRFAYDSLVREEPDSTFVPNLAASWSTTPTSATFKLRPNVTCSDGSKLTAQTVANNITYINDAKNNSANRGVWIPADATATFNNAKNTATVSTPKPSQFLLQGLSEMSIVCQAVLDHPNAYIEKTDGTGPWVLTSAVPNYQYTYTKRTYYTWGPSGTSMNAPGTPDKVEMRVVTNVTTLANLVLSGQVNYANVSGADEQRLDAAGLKYVSLLHTTGETYFNEDRGRPAADPAVRKALAMATDIPEITHVATRGHGSPSQGMVTDPPLRCLGNTVAGNLALYNVNAAKSVLEADSWKPGPGGVRVKNGQQLALTFIYPQALGTAGAAGAQLLASEWSAIGVKVTLKPFTDAELGSLLFTTGDWDAGWIAVTVGEPKTMIPFLSGQAPPQGTDYGHIDNAAYNAKAQQAEGLTGQAGCAAWHAAEVALYRNFDVIPMFNTPMKFFLKNGTLQALGGYDVFADTLRLYAS